jgi:flagella basal body P-ring formation protein FlgA
MRTGLFTLALALLPLGAPRSAAASSEEGSVRARIETAVRAVVPAGMVLSEVKVPPSLRLERDCSLELAWSGTPRPGVSSVMLVAHGKTTRRLWVPVTLQAIQPVLVAARSLVPGETLQAADVALVDRPVTPGAPAPFAVPPLTLVGSRLTCGVASGAPVPQSCVERPAPLPRGTAVTIRSRSGAVEVSAPGQLERPARPGELAEARLTSAGRLVRGRLGTDGILDVTTTVASVGGSP